MKEQERIFGWEQAALIGVLLLSIAAGVVIYRHFPAVAALLGGPVAP